MERDGLAGQAQAKGARFADAFGRRKSPKVREVRRIGLMIGIELKEKARPYIKALMARGVLALPAGPTVIRLLPPLVIEDEALDEVAARLHEVAGAPDSRRGLDFDHARLARAIDPSAFERLRFQESRSGFGRNQGRHRAFFAPAWAGSWRTCVQHDPTHPKGTPGLKIMSHWTIHLAPASWNGGRQPARPSRGHGIATSRSNAGAVRRRHR